MSELTLAMTGHFRTAVLLRLVAMVGMAAGQLLLVRLMARHLGDHALASWSLVTQVAILVLMLDLGFGTAVVRQGAGATAAFWSALRQVLWGTGCVGAVILLIVAGVGPRALQLTDGEAQELRWLAVLFAVHLLGRFRIGLSAWRWYAHDDPRPSAWIEVGLSGARPLLAAAAVWQGANVVLAGAVWCASEWVLLLIARAALRPTAAATTTVAATVAATEPVLSLAAQRLRILRDAFSSSGISLISSGPVYLAGWMIGHSATMDPIGWVNAWTCSFALPLLCLRVAYLPHQVCFPVVTRELATGHGSTLVRRYRGWILVYVLALILGSVALALLNGWFVGWWMGDARFYAGTTATLAVAGWVIVSALRSAIGNVIVAGDQSRRPVMLAHAAELALLAALSVVVVPQVGLAGFAGCLLVVQVIPLLASMPSLRRTLSTSAASAPETAR